MAIDITKYPKVNLSKIVLEKSGDTHKVNLSKDTHENIIINLNWSKNKQPKGFFSSLFSSEIDLDLGCFYELKNGEFSVIDGIQFSKNRGGARNQVTNQGCYTQSPWIWHCGDDRSGSSSEGENILINPQGIQHISRMTIYCFIYDGIANWQESDAVITIKIPNQPEIVIEMGKQTASKTFCAIAELYFDGNQIQVKKTVTFHNGHAECDKHYNWGLDWRRGGK